MLPRYLVLVLLAGRPMAGYDIQQDCAVIPGLAASALVPGHGLLLSGSLSKTRIGVQPISRKGCPSVIISPMITTQQRELALIAVSGYGGKGREALLVIEQSQVDNSRYDRVLQRPALFGAKVGAA